MNRFVIFFSLFLISQLLVGQFSEFTNKVISAASNIPCGQCDFANYLQKDLFIIHQNGEVETIRLIPKDSSKESYNHINTSEFYPLNLSMYDYVDSILSGQLICYDSMGLKKISVIDLKKILIRIEEKVIAYKQNKTIIVQDTLKWDPGSTTSFALVTTTCFDKDFRYHNHKCAIAPIRAVYDKYNHDFIRWELSFWIIFE
jgi:hypothetical protein